MTKLLKVIGLTGSIATGKSFIAESFRKHKVKVFSSDFEVSEILRNEKIVFEEIKNNFILADCIKENRIDKDILSHIVFTNLEALKILEKILHPMIEFRMKNFLRENIQEKAVLLEIPLLFEKKREVYCNKIITTFCNDKVQRERALRRKNIDKERLNFIIKQQIPSNIKASLTDYLVYTDISYSFTQKQLDQIFIKEEI